MCKADPFYYSYVGELQSVYPGKYQIQKANSTSNEYVSSNCTGFFGIDIPPSKKQNEIFIAYLRNIIFLDFRTEFFLIQFNGYNIHKNIFITLKLIFEQAPNGLTYTTYQLCTLNIFKELSDFLNFKMQLSSIINILIVLTLVLYSFLSIIDIVREIIKKKLEYYKDIWNIFKTVKVSMYCLSSFIRIYFYFTIFNSIGKQNSNEFIDTDPQCNLLNALLLLETLMACLTLIFFLRYLDKNIIEPISRTISESQKNIFVFLTSFVCCLMGFSFFSYFIYGTRSLSKSFIIYKKTLTDSVTDNKF